jgi:Leu/Phe-tRNA-protein transferase
MYLKYTTTGYLFISPEDDCKMIVNVMLDTDYHEEFCLAVDFSPEFVARLMEAGFLVMSSKIWDDKEPVIAEPEEIDPIFSGSVPQYLLLPKLHLERSALFFENLIIKKSIKRFLPRYELRPDVEFERIVDRCVEKHGDDWLTSPLVDCIKKIRYLNKTGVYPMSFALYRGGELVAGEFGVVCGDVYTSYSGYYDEDNAGTVQLILTTQYLSKQGFSFFDLGMPLNYKDDLGAVNITPVEFVSLFRGIKKEAVS